MSSRFSISSTSLSGLFSLVRDPIGDERGYLERLFCIKELTEWGRRPIAQINHTYTQAKGTVRGLHFQHPPHAECKYISCLSGAVFDVAVDIRIESATYGNWFGIELSSDAHNAIIIPEGFAHGFQTLTTNVEMLYLHSSEYCAESEDGIDALDLDLSIEWPLLTGLQSIRDRKLTKFREFKGLRI